MKKIILFMCFIAAFQMLFSQQNPVTNTTSQLDGSTSSGVITNNSNLVFSNQSDSSNSRAPIEVVYRTDETLATYNLINFSSPFSASSPKFGDKIRFTNTVSNRLITTVEVALYHDPGDLAAPIDLEISMYSNCPATESTTEGQACGSGIGTLIPGSTMTLSNFLPSDGVYLKAFEFSTPVNAYGYGDEIVVMFKATSASTVFLASNTPVTVGSTPLGEPTGSQYSGCGESLNFAGCTQTFASHTNNNILMNILADDDTTPPTAVCKDITLTLNPFLSSVNVNASMIDDGSNDGEGPVTLSIPPFGATTLNCSNVGDNNITLLVTDRAGNAATCTAVVTVENSELSFGCPSNSVIQANANCETQYTPPILLAAQSCESVTVTQTQGPTGTTNLPVGVTTFAYTATSTSGDTESCSYTVTVEDNIPPVFSNCSSNITATSTMSECGSVVAYTPPSVSDNCNLAFFAQVQGLSSGSVFPVGTTTNTWVAEDFGGNQATCSFTVTITDGTPPVITCPNDINIDNDPGSCSAIVAFNATATDNCSGAVTITYSQDPNTEFAIGTTSVTVTATDDDGNVSTCTFDINVNDTEDPTISCTADITQNNDTGLCGAVITYPDPIISDNCSGLGVTQTFNFVGSPQTFTVPNGITSISIEAFGGAGQDMVIEDFDPGIGGLGGYAAGELAVTPGDILTIYVGGRGTEGAGGYNGGAVGGFGTASTNTGGFAGSGGGASDVRLGTATLADRVLVAGGGGGAGRDFTNGTCVPCGTGGNGGAGGGLTGTDGDDPSWSGLLGDFPNVGAGGKGGTPNNGGAAGNGPQGPPGNSGTLGVGGIGIDGTQSVASGGGGGGYYGGGSGGGADSGIGVAGGGGAGGSSYIGGVTSGVTTAGQNTGDGQVIISYSYDSVITQTTGLPSGSLFPVGTTTNTFVVTDGFGNTATCSFNVTVNDIEDPTIICPADITVNNDPGNCSALVTYTAPMGMDNCTIPSGPIAGFTKLGTANGSTYYLSDSTFTGPGAFADAIANGGFAATINDATENDFVSTAVFNAVGSIRYFIGYNDAATEGTFVWQSGSTSTYTNWNPGEPNNSGGVEDYTEVVSSTGRWNDNNSSPPFRYVLELTGGTEQIAGLPSGSTFPVGTTTNTFVVTDAAGNTATCSFDVTVEDNESPTAVCMDITVELDANGDASIVASDVDGGSTDACGIASLSVDIDTFDCSNVGPNNVTLTVTDVNGNSSSCVAVVTVEDNIDPMIFCPADVVTTTSGGNCGAVVTFTTPVGMDNCGVDEVIQQAGIASGEIFPVGVTTNQFAVIDVNGNVAFCSFTVTVTDDDAPITVCQDITVMLDATGTATIVPADVDGGSTDNCGITSLSIDIDTFTCADLGDNIVTLTATDGVGLSSSCTAIVTVENGVMPNAVCQDATVQLDAFGMVSITDASIFDGGSTDACGGTNLTFSVSPDTFDCSNVGDNTVTITVTDDGGNTSTCTATLTVEDVTAPTVSCMDMTVSLDEDGLATIDPADLVLLSDDACGVVTTTADIVDFDCDDVGTPVTVTVTVADSSGNSAMCTATVTVLDELAPQFDSGSLPIDEVRMADENGEYILEDFTTDVIVTDNCSLTDLPIILDQDPAIGTVLTVGVYDITLTAEDDLGNISDYVFELTVTEFLNISENSFDISSLTIYPNPASDVVMLSNPQNIPLKEVSIYDATGRLIKALDASQMTSEMVIDISELASATYMILIATENTQLTKQLVKE